jgi:hypothetical protein
MKKTILVILALTLSLVNVYADESISPILNTKFDLTKISGEDSKKILNVILNKSDLIQFQNGRILDLRDILIEGELGTESSGFNTVLRAIDGGTGGGG